MRRWVGAVGLGAAIAAIAGAFACRQAIGIDQYFNAPADAGVSTSACGLPYGTTTCASCVLEKCCEESTACAGDPPCQPYFVCLGACAIGDWQCRSQCGVDHPFGRATAFPGLTACMASNCEAACGVTCGSVVSAFSFPPGAAARCETCFAANDCALDGGTCATSASCMGWLQCDTACSTPDCRLACSRRYGYDGGISIGDINYGAIPPSVESLSAACKTPCLAGSNWSCVGRVGWPAATMGGTKLEAQILSFAAAKTPVQDADVKICGATDPNCQAAPIPEATSDTNGFVAVDVPPTTSPLGWLTADTFAQINAAGYVPQLVFLGYPVSEPLANIAEPTVYLLTPDYLQASGSSWDMTNYGEISFEVLDCNGVQASGVQVAIDVDGGQMQEFYFVGYTPSIAATATDSAGLGGGFINVPAGNHTLTATPLTLGKASSHADVIVRKGTITQAFLFPTP